MGARQRHIAAPVLTAVAYCVVAKLSLLLAIPPGYATAVWPAAGIALAAVLISGRRNAFGVLVGSFFANLWVSVESPSRASLSTVLLTCALLAIGAALQSLAGAALVRRSVGRDTAFIRDRNIAALLLLGGPASCVISATCGVCTLVAAGILPGSAAAFSWFTWWAGDSIGVLIFTPLALTLLAKPAFIWRPRRITVGVPLCVAFVAAVAVYLFADRSEDLHYRGEFDRRAKEFSLAIQARLDRSTDVLRTVVGLYRSSVNVERGEFQTFATEAIRSNDGIHALSWVARVRADERGRFEQQFRDAGFADFQIEDLTDEAVRVRAEGRDEYFPVTYIEPLLPNRTALGFDTFVRPQTRAAMEEARDTGAPAASGRIRLVQETGEQWGIVVYAPIYRNGAAASTVEDRRRLLVGFTGAVFRIDDLIAAALAGLDRDGASIEVEEMLPSGTINPLTSTSTNASSGVDTLSAIDTISVAGRTWRVSVRKPKVELLAQRASQSWAVLAGGLSIASLLGGYLLALTGRAAGIEALVAQRTADLTRSNHLLAREQELNRRTMDELRESTRTAETATRVKSEFLANMSHEIRTPMTAILGFVDLLSDVTCTAERDSHLSVVRRNGQHLLQLINDILDVSKIEAGQLIAERTQCRLSEVVADIRTAMEPIASSKGVAFTSHCDDLVVHTDPFRLRQILLNLTSNAVKFTPSGGRVAISIRLHGADGNASAPGKRSEVVMEVADSGVGMSAEQLGRLFRPFTQADSSTTRRFGGTGLGLTISKRLADLLGGAIDVASVAGRGSTFTLRFPAQGFVADQVAPNDSVASKDAVVPEPSRQIPRLSGRVLVVDDSPDNRHLLNLYLRRAGLTVHEAADGKSGVDAVAAAERAGEPFDLILLDMQMPEMDGYQAAELLRRMPVKTPIVALTADSMEGDRQRCLAAGCDYFASKPIDVKALFAILASHLQPGLPDAPATRPAA